MKKTLSLVLVLCMVFSFFGFAGAAFTDDATVQYKEAVSVMTGIGAINGYTDGSIKPAGTITREEAAKLVTYAILGANVAKMLPAGATGFSDVAADRWSAPYIAYCVNKGIINGMGDGTFAPEANVTGYQIGKMMLTAIGYGKQGEFTGNSWALNTAILGNSKGIFAGTKAADLDKAATREEAMLYVFNALTNAKAEQVNWSKDKEAYAVSGAGTIGTDVYGLAKSDTAKADTYARPANVWTAYKLTGSTTKPVASAATATAAYTFDGGDMTEIVAKLAKDGITVPAGTKLYANGGENNFTDYASDKFGNGATIQVYLDSTGTAVDRFVLIMSYAGVVTKVIADNPKTVADETALVLTVYGGTRTVNDITILKTDKVPGFDAAYAAAQVGSFVTVDPKNDTLSSSAFLAIATAKSVTGKLTGFVNGKYVKIDGTTYPIANNCGAFAQSNINNTYSFILDAAGNVLAAHGVSNAIVSVDGIVYATGEEFETKNAYGVTIYNVSTVALDGTVKIYQNAATTEVAAAGFYKLGVSTTGTTFTAVGHANAGVKAVDINGLQTVTPNTVSVVVDGDSTNSITKAYLNSSSKYLFLDLSGTEPKVTVKTGAVTASIPDNAKALITRTATGAYELAAVIAGTSYVGEVTSDVIYVGTNAVVGYENGVALYGAVNVATGETVAFPGSAQPSANTFYTYRVNDKGVYTLFAVGEVTSAVTNVAGAYTVTGTFTAYNTKISAAAGSANLLDIEAGAAKIIDLRTNGNVDSLAEVLALGADAANYRVVVSTKDGVPFVAAILLIANA